MQAGIQLKNHLYSKDYEIRCQHQQRWLEMFPDDMKNLIKQNVSAIDIIFVLPMLSSEKPISLKFVWMSKMLRLSISQEELKVMPVCSDGGILLP